MPAPYCYEHPRPQVTVDLVVFALVEGSLRVLLVRRGREPFAGLWAIPGGFLGIDEPAEAAARRELREETGLEIPGSVEPIGFFAEPGRDPRGRTISLAHAAVVRAGEHAVKGSDDAAEAAWVDLEKLPKLAFDHDEILSRARSWLKDRVDQGEIALAILPASFTLEDVLSLFRGLEIPESNAREWLVRMINEGRVERGPGAPPDFHLSAPNLQVHVHLIRFQATQT
jgi:8-oxo-dGTP diphosphatase